MVIATARVQIRTSYQFSSFPAAFEQNMTTEMAGEASKGESSLN